MRIKSIHIKGLFDTFDHFIPFNQEDRITIIHAPNGFGKTIILKMLYGLLKMDFSIFENVPFESFVVNLEEGESIEIFGQSSLTTNLGTTYIRSICFTNKDKKIEDLYKLGNRIYTTDNMLGFVKNHIIEESVQRGNLHSANATLSALNSSELKKKGLEVSNWYVDFIKSNQAHFITTERLLIVDNEAVIGSKNSNAEEFDVMTNSVSKYATELKDIIEDTLNEYATTSQNLERTFPNRLIAQQKQENITIENIKNELNHLEERRKKLQEVGLWDNENQQDMSFQIPENTDAASLNVLNLYIQDAKDKLAVFDNLEKKIALFRKIINSRFQFKQMKIDKKKGFLFLTHKEKNLDSNDLSSGEQHQLVLLYEMLFKVKENDLVLLDEPEISLHITWQEQFLSDLIKIIELNPFDVVITTHAPEIINDRWDLTVGLTKDKENV